MTATSTLRRHLDELRIYYRPIGQSTTTVRGRDGRMWCMRDRYDGTLDARLVGPITPADAIEVVDAGHGRRRMPSVED